MYQLQPICLQDTLDLVAGVDGPGADSVKLHVSAPVLQGFTWFADFFVRGAKAVGVNHWQELLQAVKRSQLAAKMADQRRGGKWLAGDKLDLGGVGGPSHRLHHPPERLSRQTLLDDQPDAAESGSA